MIFSLHHGAILITMKINHWERIQCYIEGTLKTESVKQSSLDKKIREGPSKWKRSIVLIWLKVLKHSHLYTPLFYSILSNNWHLWNICLKTLMLLLDIKEPFSHKNIENIKNWMDVFSGANSHTKTAVSLLIWII